MDNTTFKVVNEMLIEFRSLDIVVKQKLQKAYELPRFIAYVSNRSRCLAFESRIRDNVMFNADNNYFTHQCENHGLLLVN